MRANGENPIDVQRLRTFLRRRKMLIAVRDFALSRENTETFRSTYARHHGARKRIIGITVLGVRSNELSIPAAIGANVIDH